MPTITPQQDLNLQRWIMALRTTTIPQAKGKLFRIRTYGSKNAGACCLGIACEAFQVPFEDQEIVYNRTYIIEHTNGPAYSIQEQLPETTLKQTFGLSRKDQYMLTALNDDENWTFAQIADWLEQFRQASLGNGPFPANPLTDND